MKKSQLKKLSLDPEATAKAVRLVYVNSSDEGITRVKAGKGFAYKKGDKLLKDKTQLERIRSLVLPPAWKDVWICTLPNGHLQATGKDIMNRKQYRYHPLWNQLRNTTKFYRMLELGKVLPAIRKQIRKDLELPGLPRNKVLAVVISLMEKTGIRIGNEFYEKLYGSFGLTTLKDRHVDIKGGRVQFTFRGKKGVEHQVSLQSKKLSKIVNQCRDIPGKELFQYIDEEGKRQCIESGMVNEYIREIAEGEFTAKDFRTWCGSVAALNAFKETGAFEDEKEAKKKIVEVLDKVAVQLGNTRTVCKKYYVHPCLLEMYEEGKLHEWLGKTGATKKHDSALYAEEKV
ncbi:MAG: DNA topoisomerase IB, partial [Ferruginibacter sp.]|nr:DNA topoisomerase IB [Chitinophagaceae bacterium]